MWEMGLVRSFMKMRAFCIFPSTDLIMGPSTQGLLANSIGLEKVKEEASTFNFLSMWRRANRSSLGI